MKVYYPGPGERTYHPVLGMLTKKPFDLDVDPAVAKPFLESGLIRKYERKASPAAVTQAPRTTKKRKNSKKRGE